MDAGHGTHAQLNKVWASLKGRPSGIRRQDPATRSGKHTEAFQNRVILIVGMRSLVLAAAAAIVLAGCSNASAPRTPPKPLRPITATFLDSRGAPSVTAVQFLDPLHGWIGVMDTPYFEGQKVLSDGALLRTTAGGRSLQVVAHTKLPILAIDFSSPQDGFVLVGAWIDTTTQFTLYGSPDGGGALRTLSRRRPWLVTPTGLFETRDGGRMWRPAAPSR